MAEVTLKIAQWNCNTFLNVDKAPCLRQFPIILLQEARSAYASTLYYSDYWKAWNYLNNEKALCTLINKTLKPEIYLNIVEESVTAQIINIEFNGIKYRIGNICISKKAPGKTKAQVK